MKELVSVRGHFGRSFARAFRELEPARRQVRLAIARAAFAKARKRSGSALSAGEHDAVTVVNGVRYAKVQ